MELRQFTHKEVIENYENLRKICWWVDKSLDTDIYGLFVENDLKSVFTLARFGTEISTTKTLEFGTKLSESGKGYATSGTKLLFESIKKREDIEKVIIQALNKKTTTIASKFDLEHDTSGSYFFSNPNFNPKYNELVEKIKKNDIDVVEFCSGNKEMLDCLKTWIEIRKNNKEHQESSNGFDIEAFIASSPRFK